MAKRKKSKRHPRSEKVAAPGTEDSATGDGTTPDVTAAEAEGTSLPSDPAEAIAKSADSDPSLETAPAETPVAVESDVDATAADPAGDVEAKAEEPATEPTTGSAGEPTVEAPEVKQSATGRRKKNRPPKGKKTDASEPAETEPVAAAPEAEPTDAGSEGDKPDDTGAAWEATPSEVEADAATTEVEVDTHGSEAEFAAAWAGGNQGTDEPGADAIPPEAEQSAAAEIAPEADASGTTEGEAPASDAGGEDSGTGDGQSALEGDRLESIIESLLFASDKALGLSDLKRLLGERDGKKITAAVQSLIQKRIDTGIQVVTLSSGWHLRTAVDNAAWVSKLLVGKPVRLSRAMMETLAIVAYRQPVTRPEIDDIRGVDCGPVLKTLLERGLVRIIGKKEEVGRPMLYGTTPEFLRVFNLRDLTELPTLREFYDLSAEDQSKVDAEAPQTPSATTAKPEVALNSVSRGGLAPEDEDADPLLDELDEASKAAKQALGDLDPKPEEDKTEDRAEDKADDAQARDTAEPKHEPDSTETGE